MNIGIGRHPLSNESLVTILELADEIMYLYK